MATNNAINTNTNSFCKTANNLSDVATPATAALNLFTTTAVNTTAVLAASAYGTEVICTGAAAYSVTLPTVTSNANKFIDIYSQTTSHALVTITPASGTIAGQATLVIGTGDGVRIMNDGTNWWVLNTWLQPVNFVATLSANQSIPANAATTVAWDGTDYNVGSFFNTGTSTFTPLMPGKYLFEHSGLFDPDATAGITIANYIRKNGSSSIARDIYLPNVASASKNLLCSSIVAMNGSTDSIIGVCFQNSGIGAVNYQPSSGSLSHLLGYRISLF